MHDLLNNLLIFSDFVVSSLRKQTHLKKEQLTN